MEYPDSVRKKLGSLDFRSRRGQALLLYTLLLCGVLIPVVGLSVDLVRVYIVQGRLQAALDAAALGATRLLATTANTTEIAGEFVTANFPASYFSSSVPTVTQVSTNTTTGLNPNVTTVTVKGTVSVPLIFLGPMFHSSSLVASATGSRNAFSLTGCTLAYPYGSAPALTSVPFNESMVLYASGPSFVYPHGKIMVWYGDEHALTLGVREVQLVTVTTTSGSASASGPASGSTTTTTTTVTSTTDYTVATYNATTMNAVSFNGPLAVGTTALSGTYAGTDTATWNATYGYLDQNRPLWPALYITDITTSSSSTSGDWQMGGTGAIPPNAVYGTWKFAVRTVDTSTSPYTITVTPDADPSTNVSGTKWNGVPDTPPGGFTTTEGYGTEVVWSIDSLGLRPGHTYRLQFMIHDGDQNQSGGDVGEGCAIAIY